ncbi:MAG: glycosyltransferase family 2 protein [Oxalobacter sp.]
MDSSILSIVVTSYNYEKYIGESLSSLVNQTVKDLEIIVVDDGCREDSVS